MKLLLVQERITVKVLLLCCYCNSCFSPFLFFASAFSSSFLTTNPSAHYTSRSSSAISASLIDIDENADAMRDIGTMDEWTMNCGVQRSDGFQLISNNENVGEINNNDYSVFTTEPIPAGTPVLYVPNEMMFCSNRVRDEISSNYGSEIIDEVENLLSTLGVAKEYFQQYYLFLKILIEYEQGTDSPWYPWLNSLPRKFSNGASMTPYCFECLPPLTSKLSSNERVKFIYFYKSLSNVPFLSDETKTDQELSKWAYNVVYTRCFGSALVPMADMFNHATQANVQIQYDENGDDNNCYVYTTTDVPENSQLFLSYGDPTNPSHLFATYGFLDESSPATFCKIMDIKSTQELQNLGLDFTRMLFFKETGDVTTEVWDVLLYITLDELNERSIQKLFYDAHMNGDVDTKNDIHQRYFQHTSKKLKNHVDTFLVELDHLSQKALTKDVNEHPRIPIILKHNDFVKQTFLKVQTKLNDMMMEAAI